MSQSVEAPVAPGTTGAASAPAATAVAKAPPAVSGASKGSVPADGDDDLRFEPCQPNTPGHDEATNRLAAFAKLVDGLKHYDDPRATNAALAHVLENPCFSSTDSWGELVADSGLAMKTWWDRGGSMWLEHHLELWNVDAELRYWVMPNAMPKTLNLDVTSAHPLASILCRHDDKTCGAATRGWLARAATHFELYAHSKHDSNSGAHTNCEEAVGNIAERERFAKWVECEKRASPKIEALPLGEFRAPEDGWLVVRGRRGHYGFCDEIRAYGLKAGALYVVKSCSGLALNSDGSVDHRKTDAARKVDTSVARLPLDNLREAALMVLLSAQAQDGAHWYAWGRAIPKGMKATRSMFGGLGMSFSSGSGHTTLRWTYLRKGKSVAGGTLRYPDDLNSAAKDHAMRLLLVAEAGRVEGCAPERLAKLPLGQPSPGVSPLDADPLSLADADASLVAGISKLRAGAKICR